MTLQEHISELLDNPTATVDAGWVDETYRRFPFFTLPSLLLLERDKSLNAEQRSNLMSRTALNAADKETLFRLTDPDAAMWADFYPEEPKAKPITTNTAIDTFIDTYGTADPREEEILTRLIFNPTPDYAQLLAEEEEKSTPDPADANDKSQDALINAFILKSREHQGHFPPSEEEEPIESQPAPIDDVAVSAPEITDDSLLSESLAKIYIKQHRYTKAYEIIHSLNLNFPEKSIYFADQLRFLQKLIINQQHNNNKTQ
ncbi:MAG: hypothetical protein IJY31_07060 [Muribaculaceae bacterium]|nr:hypothetical protein [Muribaculaceae bacterium]